MIHCISPQATPEHYCDQKDLFLPKAPWQMSVRLAPSTMNSGFEHSSFKNGKFDHNYTLLRFAMVHLSNNMFYLLLANSSLKRIS